MLSTSAKQIARDRIRLAEQRASTGLDLSRLGLKSLPAEIGRLSKLTLLGLSNNQLTSLPAELGDLKNLDYLSVEGNPLPAALMAAHRRGVDELKAYLRSLKQGEPLYEAKLVLVSPSGYRVEGLTMATIVELLGRLR